MNSPKNITLTDLFNLYTESPNVIVIKNISDKTSRDTLANYLAGILYVDVKEVHYPVDVNGCCLAIFYRPIRGLGKYGRTLDQQPLHGHVLALSSLGSCNGLLIRNPPSEVCTADLEKFLRSEEFTGATEESVIDIEQFACDTGRFVVVQIPDTAEYHADEQGRLCANLLPTCFGAALEAVISRILNRSKQPQCQNHDLDIDPYFPNVHDLLREQGSHGMPCLEAEVCKTDGTIETVLKYIEEPKKEDAMTCTCINQREDNTELESDGLSDVSTENEEMINDNSLRSEAAGLEVNLTDKEESIEEPDCDFIKNESSFIETVRIGQQKSQCKRTSLDYDNIKLAEQPPHEPNISNSVSNSKPDDEFDRTDISDSESQAAPIIGHSCQPASERYEESAENPLSKSCRFRQLVHEMQYGLSDEEAMQQALELSLSDQNLSGLTKEEYRRDSTAHCTDDDKVHLGKDIDNQVCEQVNATETAGGVAMQKPVKPSGKEVRKDLARALSSDDASKSKSEPDLRVQPSEEAGFSQLANLFDNNGGQNQRHRIPSKGHGTASKSTQRFNIERQRLQKLEQEEKDEAIARSIADQEIQKLQYMRNKSDHYRKQRPHSTEAKYSDSKASSAGAQGEDSKQCSPLVQAWKNVKYVCLGKIEKISEIIPKNKRGSSAEQNTGKESLAKNDGSKQAKETTMVIEKHETISDGARGKIRNILRKYNVKSTEILGMKKYMLEGDKESVERAYEEILGIVFIGDTCTEYEAGSNPHKHLGARRKIVEYMALKDEPKVPKYWKNFNPGSSITNALQTPERNPQLFTKDHVRVELDSGDPVFQAIKNLIESTWDEEKVGHGKDAKGLDALGYRKMKITKIHRIENLQLYEKYSRHRKRTFFKIHREGRKCCNSVEKIPNSLGPVMTRGLTSCPALRSEIFPEINEYFVFHGTPRDVIDAICNTGIDFRVGSPNAMYGAGIYGAESPTKADQYVDSQSQRGKKDRQMLLVRMVLGDSYLCSDQDPYKYRRPPCADMKHLRDDCTNSSHGSFDSVIGQSRMFREFVVYEKDQCYPEYLITYNRK